MDITFFSYEQGNILVRLLIAHLAADFLLQTKYMVHSKRWLSAGMLCHILIVYLCTAILSGWWYWSLLIAIAHYLTDGLKYELQRRKILPDLFLFLADQVMHIVALLLVWAHVCQVQDRLLPAIAFPFTDYRLSLILLGYLLVIFPAGYITGFITRHWNQGGSTATAYGGKYIGIFERIIILTFVLLGQYEAIGFLITGKSIIRFVNKEEHIRSEYVLIGTMVSYALSIITGVLIRWLSGGI